MTRPLHNHCSIQSRHCHCNKTVIQLPFSYRATKIVKPSTGWRLHLNNYLFQGRSKIFLLHTYHGIYKLFIAYKPVLHPCTPVKYKSLALITYFPPRSSICHETHTQSTILLCDWLLRITVLTLLQQLFISLSATLCTR